LSKREELHMPPYLVKVNVIFAIFLLISVVFFPSIQIQSVKAVYEKDYVDLMAEICGINDVDSRTVRLSKEQYNLLQQYLFEFQNRFNNATTLREALPLYKELVIQLATFDLLPKGMTIQQALNRMLQGLGGYKTVNQPATLPQNTADSGYNIGCLISGELHHVLSYFVPVVLPLAAAYLLLFLLFFSRLAVFEFITALFFPWYWRRPDPFILDVLTILMDKLQKSFVSYFTWTAYSPGAFFSRIRFIENMGTGRVRTIGLLGVKQWDGNLKGIIPPINDTVIGFTGFKLANIGGESFFFTGCALAVGVRYRDA
jgi:hypothetical protein